MEYRSEIVIDLPQERVVDLSDSADTLFNWQPGLIGYRFLGGEDGQAGAKTRLTHDMNYCRVETIETIVKRDLPDEFSARYEAKGSRSSPKLPPPSFALLGLRCIIGRRALISVR